MRAICEAAQRILASAKLRAEGNPEFYDLVQAVGCTIDRRSVGFLASTDIGSFVQLMIDLEITGYFERLLQGIRVTPQTVAEEIIKQVVPTGARYQEHPPHAHPPSRRALVARAGRPSPPKTWAENPTTMLDNARAKARDLMESATNQCPLDERQKAEIRCILAAADRELG